MKYETDKDRWLEHLALKCFCHYASREGRAIEFEQTQEDFSLYDAIIKEAGEVVRYAEVKVRAGYFLEKLPDIRVSYSKVSDARLRMEHFGIDTILILVFRDAFGYIDRIAKSPPDSVGVIARFDRRVVERAAIYGKERLIKIPEEFWRELWQEINVQPAEGESVSVSISS